MSASVTIRIFDRPAFRSYAYRTVLDENTTILDKCTVDVNDEVVLHGWSPATVDFWITLLHIAEEQHEKLLDAFNVTIEQLWSIVSFYEMYVRPKRDRDLSSVQEDEVRSGNFRAEEASSATLKLRHWFSGWWEDHVSKILETKPEDLAQLVIPALYIGDAKVFMDVTHDWFLHTRGRQSCLDITDLSDEAGKGTLAIRHPMLGEWFSQLSSLSTVII